jgi:hypothetical protein
MRLSRSAAALLLVPLVALTAGACTSDEPAPAGPPAQMTARLSTEAQQKTYTLTACSAQGEATLIAYGTDKVNELLVINVTDGAGDVSLLDATETPAIEGTVDSYTFDDAQLFTIQGTYPKDGEQLPFEVWGNCTAEPDA